MANAILIPSDTLKAQLDGWVAQYRNRDFIASDPMQFPHRWRHDPIACEYLSLLCALLSYGRRSLIITMLHQLLERLDGDLLAYLATFDPQKARRDLAGFYYRFNQAEELVWLLERLAHHYRTIGSLEPLWLRHGRPKDSLAHQLAGFLHEFAGEEPAPATYGARYLLTDPRAGGACKRWMLFLRWVVRCDEDLAEPVDFGLWRRVMGPQDLVIPVDTHVGRLSRQWRLTARSANDWRTAEEITAGLRAMASEDPTIYDFAFLGVGVSGVVSKTLPEYP